MKITVVRGGAATALWDGARAGSPKGDVAFSRSSITFVGERLDSKVDETTEASTHTVSAGPISADLLTADTPPTRGCSL